MTPRSALRSAPLVVMALVVTILVSGIGYAFAADGGDTEVVALGPGDVTVEINIHYSRFQPERLVVAAGTRVRFLVVNDDPIFHELITGGPEVHRRHANGTEAQHPSIPGEVTVGPNEMAITPFTFDEAGIFEFACHLPGHYEYGMRGEIEVLALRGP